MRSNPRPSFSLSKAQALWPPLTRLRYDALTDRSWSHCEFVARPLARSWTGKLQPLLAISLSRLIVAAGSCLYSYKFMVPIVDGEAPPMIFEGSCSLTERHEPRRDITGITFVADGGLDQTFYLGFQDGALERVFLIPPSRNGQPPLTIERRLTDMQLHDGNLIESIFSEGNYLLSLSASGTAALSDLSTETLSSNAINLLKRSWTSHLCMRSSTPYAAFGTSSTTPLTIHSIENDRLVPTPSAILYTNTNVGNLLDNLPSSAVYGISRPPPSSPWGSSPQILVAGWYDGQVRCYDLRSSSRTSSSFGTPTPLRPVLSLSDPWSYESIYDVSCGGGSASHIAAGSARHSVVSFWDVRFPNLGWSVHAPGNDTSPVYSVILESSRLFGATHSRPFVYDFGPGVTLDTYPHLPQTRGFDGLKRKKDLSGIGYYVTTYYHYPSTIGNEH